MTSNNFQARPLCRRTVSFEQYTFTVNVMDVEEGALVFEVVEGSYAMEDGTTEPMRGELQNLAQQFSPLISGLLWEQIKQEKEAL